MLLSNWDSKDQRDVARGSNTAIFEYRLPGGRREARYLITDWGGSMGRWGTYPVTRANWDPKPSKHRRLSSSPACLMMDSYSSGMRAAYGRCLVGDPRRGCPLADAVPGRLTDRQILDGLRASGASPEEAARYCSALRARIDRLAAIVEGKGKQA
jgi:hypothetical protein